MQIDFEALAATAIAVEQTNQQTDAETDSEPVVAANDNEIRWILLPFPEDWYASF